VESKVQQWQGYNLVFTDYNLCQQCRYLPHFVPISPWQIIFFGSKIIIFSHAKNGLTMLVKDGYYLKAIKQPSRSP
jgi:hypothetical protein